MIVLNLQYPPPTPPLSSHNTTSRLIAFTTPHNYAPRLSHLIALRGWTPLWCPTVIVEPTQHTISSIQEYISTFHHEHVQKPPLEEFSGIAFTSRTGITAFSEALESVDTHPLSPHGETFIVSALGKDSEMLNESFVSKLCQNPGRVQLLVPSVATPSGLVESLGLGQGRKVLCPVPLVLGLEEPPVVPRFLQDLAKKGWMAVRVNAYETRWAGPNCAVEVVERSEEGGGLDAVVFTSTGEVEGLLKSLRKLGLDWEMVRKRCPRMVVAAHGPVTASGAEQLGVGIDVGRRVHYMLEGTSVHRTTILLLKGIECSYVYRQLRSVEGYPAVLWISLPFMGVWHRQPRPGSGRCLPRAHSSLVSGFFPYQVYIERPC